MSENKITLTKISEGSVINEKNVIFSKSNTTKHYYKELIRQNKKQNEAIQEVCRAFDEFCSTTTDEDYLIVRYTEFYNNNKYTKPVALNIIIILITVLVNLGIDAFITSFDSIANHDLNIGHILLLVLFNSAALAVVTLVSTIIILNGFKDTNKPYNLFVRSYERKRLYNELIKRGYSLEKYE